MRRSLLLACLLLGGCASTQSTRPAGDSPQAPVLMHKMGTGLDVSMGGDIATVSSAVPAPVDRAYQALPRAYAALGIEVRTLDPAAHVVGSPELHVRGRLAGRRLSELLDCGNNSTGPIADQYSIRLNVRTELVAAGATSEARTTVSAIARNMDGTLSSDIRCGSKGTLEPLITTALLTALGG
jgi:hypothetical protein